MQVHDRFDDGQSEPGPSWIRAASRIRSVEAVENPWQMFQADAAAGILYVDFDGSGILRNH
jgi:hypothetical protein